MKRWLWLVALGLLPSNALLAQEDRPPPTKTEPGKQAESAKDEYAAIQKEWQNQQMAFRKKYQEAKPEDRNKLITTDYPKAGPLAKRCLALAEKWPDANEAADALFWVLTNDNPSADTQSQAVKQLQNWLDKVSLEDLNKKLSRNYYLNSPDMHNAVLAKVEKSTGDAKAVSVLIWLQRQGLINPGSTVAKRSGELLLTKFIDSKDLGQFALGLGDSRDAKAIETLRTILEKNPHDEVKASACVALAKHLGKKEATQPEAEKLLERAINELPGAGKAVKASAKGELNELKFLAIGKVIPDVKGNDLDDKEFKISDYRGKVVLLDFWGFW
jgi:hypothetical protein